MGRAAGRAILLTILVGPLSGCAVPGFGDRSSQGEPCLDSAWTPTWVEPGLYRALAALPVAPQGYWIRPPEEFQEAVRIVYRSDGWNTSFGEYPFFESADLPQEVQPARLRRVEWRIHEDGQPVAAFFADFASSVFARAGLRELQEKGVPSDYRIIHVSAHVDHSDVVKLRAWFEAFLASAPAADELEQVKDFVRFQQSERLGSGGVDPQEYGFEVKGSFSSTLVRPAHFGNEYDRLRSEGVSPVLESSADEAPGTSVLRMGDWSFEFLSPSRYLSTQRYTYKEEGWRLAVDGMDQVRILINRVGGVRELDVTAAMEQVAQVLEHPLDSAPPPASVHHSITTRECR